MTQLTENKNNETLFSNTNLISIKTIKWATKEYKLNQSYFQGKTKLVKWSCMTTTTTKHIPVRLLSIVSKQWSGDGASSIFFVNIYALNKEPTNALARSMLHKKW